LYNIIFYLYLFLYLLFIQFANVSVSVVHGPLLNLALYWTLTGFVWVDDEYVNVHDTDATAPDDAIQSYIESSNCA